MTNAEESLLLCADDGDDLYKEVTTVCGHGAIAPSDRCSRSRLGQGPQTLLPWTPPPRMGMALPYPVLQLTFFLRARSTSDIARATTSLISPKIGRQ